LENAQQLRERLNTVTANSAAGQYSADSVEALLTVERVSGAMMRHLFVAE